MKAIRRLAGGVPQLASHLVLGGVGALLCYAVGRPMGTADAWLHLKLGEAYAAQGPWLEADPILYTAERPPTAAAWLSDLLLFGLQQLAGFQGLRIAHVLAVVVILWLAHSLLRRESCLAAWASFGTTVFIALAGFRLAQLRPQLVTIAFVFILYRLLMESRQVPSLWRIGAAALLMGLWANLHAGFVLGPLLVAAAIAGLLVAAALGVADERGLMLARARALGLALLAGSLATFANPDGPAPHLAYFAAGDDSPALEFVLDEWRAFPFLGPLQPGLPPSPLSWVLGWVLIPTTPLLGALCLWQVRARAGSPADPALIGVACAGALVAGIALRFQWLGLFTLLLMASLLRPQLERGAARWITTGASVVVSLSWALWGEWPYLLQSVPRELALYARPYTTQAFHGHGAWLLRDTGVEGHLYNRYVHGNYLGYWLAPTLRPFIAGSLNVPADLIDAYFAINQRRGLGDLDFEALLDHHQVDVFMGVGAPSAVHDARPQFYTTAHLEGSAGWIQIFRNLRTSLWLRRNERNAHNLERVSSYYHVEGVSFDLETGFDPVRVLEETPRWAVHHGLAPADFRKIRSAAAAGRPGAQRRLSMVHALLGDYEGSVEIDRDILATRERDLGTRRRLVWSLLRLGRVDEAVAAAQPLVALDAPRSLEGRLAAAAERIAALEPAARPEELAQIRVLTTREFEGLLAKFVQAPPRETR